MPDQSEHVAAEQWRQRLFRAELRSVYLMPAPTVVAVGQMPGWLGSTEEPTNSEQDESENRPSEQINNMASTDAKMLLIYGTVRELQIETRVESRRARMATKKLQATVRKIAKFCVEIEEKLNTVENRTLVVEVEVETVKEQVETQGGQLTDIMWKLEDFENWQRRKNLRFLGIEGGAGEMILEHS
ncbi:hypothetical protein NDU88_006248 [Pleurodeles waltl]|uniref:Uncharacterized protein n=1 Tax=Pleurodeles waltl TaxID=8319 RepID=A0AAV7PL95_PLEWA|nr:hypothetical protein NDU88_006248 [Pleurodeles waltl]